MDDPFKRPANSKKRVLEPTATNTKRIKVDRPEKERLLDEDYIRKWTRAFKNIVLYFDKPPENSMKDEIVLLSTRLGARVEDFFSKKVTHLITSRDIPRAPNLPFKSPIKSPPRDKENKPKKVLSRQATPTYGDEAVTGSSTYTMVDPYSQKTHSITDTQPRNPFLDRQNDDILVRAQELRIKVWTYSKIHNLLSHLVTHSDKHRHANLRRDGKEVVFEGEQSLKAMLNKEKLQGTTERDRSVRTHDYYYFSRNIKYILVEDAKYVFRPILIQEYANPRQTEEPSWPILFACRDERNPFAKYYQNEQPFDGRVFAHKKWDMQHHINYVVEAQLARLCKQGVITMVKHVNNGENDEQAEDANESRGGVAQADEDAYVAASGNSVTITSTNATSQAANAHAHTAQRDKRLMQLNRRITDHRPKTTHPRASFEIFRGDASGAAPSGEMSGGVNESAVASTSKNVAEQTPTSAHASFEQMLQHRRSSKGKPVVEEGAKPTNAAQALLRAREHVTQVPPDPKLRRRSNDKFEENVAALKSRSTERRVSGSKEGSKEGGKDSSVKEPDASGVREAVESAEAGKENAAEPAAESPPPKEILATKEARAAFKEVLPRKNIPSIKTPNLDTPPTHKQNSANALGITIADTPAQPQETAPSKEVANADKEVEVAGVSQETVELLNQMEMLQKQKHKEKLSRRHENLKPGYCEICRVKFEDFDKHLVSTRHQKQATNPKIWRELDSLLEKTARPPTKELPPLPPPTPAPPSPPRKVNMLKRTDKKNNTTAEELQEMIINPHVPVNVESTYIQNSQPTTVATTQTASQSQSQSQSSKKSAEGSTSQRHANDNEVEVVDLTGGVGAVYPQDQQQQYEQQKQLYEQQQPQQQDIPFNVSNTHDAPNSTNTHNISRASGYFDDLRDVSAESYQLQHQLAQYDMEAEWSALQDIINPARQGAYQQGMTQQEDDVRQEAQDFQLVELEEQPAQQQQPEELPKAISHESITREDILSLIDDDKNAAQVYDDGDGYVEEDQLIDDQASNADYVDAAGGVDFVINSPLEDAPQSFSVFDPPTQSRDTQLPRSGGNMDLVNTLTEVFRQMSDDHQHSQHQHSQSQHQSSSHSLVEHPGVF